MPTELATAVWTVVFPLLPVTVSIKTGFHSFLCSNKRRDQSNRHLTPLTMEKMTSNALSRQPAGVWITAATCLHHDSRSKEHPVKRLTVHVIKGLPRGFPCTNPWHIRQEKRKIAINIAPRVPSFVIVGMQWSLTFGLVLIAKFNVNQASKRSERLCFALRNE